MLLQIPTFVALDGLIMNGQDVRQQNFMQRQTVSPPRPYSTTVKLTNHVTATRAGCSRTSAPCWRVWSEVRFRLPLHPTDIRPPEPPSLLNNLSPQLQALLAH
jgi:hypothetical protein